MQAVIRGQPVELLVHTVTLRSEESPSLYGFHCTACGQTLAQINGNVAKIYPHYEPDANVTVVRRCKRCGRDYVFQTYEQYKDPRTQVVLYNDNRQENYFFCYLANLIQPLLRYNGTSVYDFVNRRKQTIPFSVKCPHENCPIEYNFKELV